MHNDGIIAAKSDFQKIYVPQRLTGVAKAKIDIMDIPDPTNVCGLENCQIVCKKAIASLIGEILLDATMIILYE